MAQSSSYLKRPSSTWFASGAPTTAPPPTMHSTSLTFAQARKIAENPGMYFPERTRPTFSAFGARLPSGGASEEGGITITTDKKPEPMSTGTKIAIGVGATVAAVGLAALIYAAVS